MPREKRCGALDSCFGPHQQSIPQLLSLASRVYKGRVERSTCGFELMRFIPTGVHVCENYEVRGKKGKPQQTIQLHGQDSFFSQGKKELPCRWDWNRRHSACSLVPTELYCVCVCVCVGILRCDTHKKHTHQTTQIPNGQ